MERDINNQYLFLKNISLFNHKGEIFTPFRGWSNLVEGASPEINILTKKLLHPKFYISNKNLILFDAWSKGYFHWIADVLLKLFIIRNELSKWRIILPKDLLKFQMDSFRMFEYFEKIEPPQGWQVGVAGKLNVILLPWQSGYFNDPIYDEYFDWLNKRIKNVLGNEKRSLSHGKIFLNRSDAKIRKLINLNEIQRVFDGSGFESPDVSNMGFFEQAQLFQSCKTLAGPHGAGLVNMVYMPRGGTILELRSSYPAGNNIYERLAKKLGHNYYPIVSADKNYKDDFQNANILVPPTELKKVLKEI